MHSPTPAAAATARKGIVLHAPRFYDFFVRVATLGRERTLRATMLHLARLRPGETVLDVGCGTGTLAIAAARQTGAPVCGMDASPEMLAHAHQKARRAGVDVLFSQARAEALPYPDAKFNLVLATMMLHHLPRSLWPQVFREMRRVLASDGRLLLVDFTKSQQPRRTLAHRLHHRHGHIDLAQAETLLQQAGFTDIHRGPLGTMDLHYILAAASGTLSAPPDQIPAPAPVTSRARRLLLWLGVLMAILVTVATAHAALLRLFWSHSHLSLTLTASVGILFLLTHLHFAAPLVALFRRWHRRDLD